jgi:hypothetical protein
VHAGGGVAVAHAAQPDPTHSQARAAEPCVLHTIALLAEVRPIRNAGPSRRTVVTLGCSLPRRAAAGDATIATRRALLHAAHRALHIRAITPRERLRNSAAGGLIQHLSGKPLVARDALRAVPLTAQQQGARPGNPDAASGGPVRFRALTPEVDRELVAGLCEMVPGPAEPEPAAS